ncbi:MAG: alpha/beta hydrolase [Isosphaeraceae bacterium]|nr:alpha/beta hydrolase [Isosphaeraceae bacterium]
MRIMVVGLSLLFVCGLATMGRMADAPAPTTLEVWPGPAPGEEGVIGEEKVERKPGEGTIRSITNVSKPTLTVYRPDRAKDTGIAIIVCPGGGYNNLAWDHEGEQVARWLNSIGVTAALLKYRVPRRAGTPKDQPPPQALMDAQRALSLVRSKAADWGIDPKRIGILGFSAGGHLSAWAATNFDRRAYEPIDETDRITCRPDFAVLVYPGGVVKRGTDQLAPEIRVSDETPPIFLVHASDDRVSAENSIYLYLALKRAGVPAEMHIYASGGHGFGMRPSDKPCSTWPQRCEDWLRAQGVLRPSETR